MKPEEVVQKGLEQLDSKLKDMFSPIIELGGMILFEIPVKFPFTTNLTKSAIIIDGTDNTLGVTILLDKTNKDDNDVEHRICFEAFIHSLNEDSEKDLEEIFDIPVSADWLKMRILEMKDTILSAAEGHFQQLSRDWKSIQLDID